LIRELDSIIFAYNQDAGKNIGQNIMKTLDRCSESLFSLPAFGFTFSSKPQLFLCFVCARMGAICRFSQIRHQGAAGGKNGHAYQAGEICNGELANRRYPEIAGKDG